MKETLVVSVSGGLSSEYMSKFLIDKKSDEYNLVHVVMNTGQEHEKTLEFIDKCDKEFGQNLIWIEAVVHHGKRKSSSHKVVTFETASRNGAPFEEVIKKYGISNMDYPHCNRELKLRPFDSLMRELNLKGSLRAIGIRADEIDRMSSRAKEDGIIYPLIGWNPTTKAEVRHWWKDQEFDLGIPEHLGNCVTCWKKSKRKLMTIAKHEPERFDFFDRMEKEYSLRGAHMYKEESDILDSSGERIVVDRKPIPRVFFRGRKSSQDILLDAQEPFDEFVDIMPELQTELDFSNGCSESCDIYADE